MFSSIVLVVLQIGTACAENPAPVKPLYLQLTEGQTQQKAEREANARKAYDAKEKVNAFNSELERQGLVNTSDAANAATPPSGEGNGSRSPAGQTHLGVKVPINTSSSAATAPSVSGIPNRALTPEEEAAARQLQEQAEKLKEALSKSFEEP